MFEIRANPEELRELVRSVVREVMRQRPAEGQGRPAAAKLLYGDAEAAEALGVSVRTFWRMVKDGELPQPIKLRSKTLWRVAELEAWVERQPAEKEKSCEQEACNGHGGD